MAIQDLLGETPAQVFVGEHYHKLPYSGTGGSKSLSHLASWESLERMLGIPGVDLLVVREGRRYDGEIPKNVVDAQALHGQGYTLAVRGAQRHSSQIAELANGFETDFAAPVDVHLYYTPAGQYGFGWHYDAEDVFILQASGTKEYLLRKNTVHPWPLVETLPDDMGHRHEIMPLVRCTLSEGDWLYIPAGYWHRAESREDSRSLAVGLMSPAAIELFDQLRARLLSSLRWRQRLPCLGAAAGTSAEDLERRYTEICQDLAADLRDQMSDPALIRQFLAEKQKASAQTSAGDKDIAAGAAADDVAAQAAESKSAAAEGAGSRGGAGIAGASY